MINIDKLEAAAKIDTEDDIPWTSTTVIELITRLREAEKQRDELLALEGILNSPETRIGYGQYQSACDAITSVKGDAA